MDNQAIEQTAVSVIERRVNLTDYLSSFLDSNDKTPSWDGSIYLYNNEQKTKSNLIGRVSSQIKGHEVSNNYYGELDQKSISFSIEVAHLKNYLNDGGAILFVVYLRRNAKGTDFDTQPYYIELTPVRIMSFLKECGYYQKEKTLHLKKLPDDPVSFASMVLNCYKNCKMQASFAGAELPSVEELEGKAILESLSFLISGYGEKTRSIRAFLTADTYLYARIKGGAIPQPVDIGEMINKVIKCETSGVVQIDGKVYYHKIKQIFTEEKTVIQFGYGISLELENEKRRCRFIYKASDKMREFVADTPFILAFCKTKVFYINCIPFDFRSIESAFDNFDIVEMERIYGIQSRCVEMLDRQGCTEDIDCTTLSRADWRNLQWLTEATLEGKPIHGLSGYIAPIMNMPIGQLNFAIGLTESKDEPGAYYLCNALDVSNEFVVGFENDSEKIPVPVCAVFRTADFIRFSNIRFDKLLPLFKEFPINSYLYEVANDLMLRMISASDLADGERKQLLLDTAQEFAEWLDSMPLDVWDKRIATLNKFQINKRKRVLSNEEKDILRRMIIEAVDRIDIQFGASVLLDDIVSTEYYFSKLSVEHQNVMRQYPIYHFVNSNDTHLLP